ncbi:MAG TPA: PEP-CTERM sorting domain-containing protein [Armatimonadota bacterium]|jgi:hypothetical protein
MQISVRIALAGLALLAPVTGRCGIVLISDFDGNGTQPAASIFQAPDFSGSTNGFLVGAPSGPWSDSTTNSTARAYSGATSLNVQWQFSDADPTKWLRLTTSGYNPVIDAAGALTMKVYVASEDPLQVAIGVRERAYASDPALGSVGAGGSGTGIEWVGANGAFNKVATTVTHTITPGSWQDLTFIIPQEPIAGFVGNGIIEPKAPYGKVDLEHLAFRIPGGSAKPVNLYVDDIRIVTADSLNAVPEPGSLALLAMGVLPLLGLRRRAK